MSSRTAAQIETDLDAVRTARSALLTKMATALPESDSVGDIKIQRNYSRQIQNLDKTEEHLMQELAGLRDADVAHFSIGFDDDGNYTGTAISE